MRSKIADMGSHSRHDEGAGAANAMDDRGGRRTALTRGEPSSRVGSTSAGPPGTTEPPDLGQLHFERPTAWWDVPAGFVIGLLVASALFLSVPLTHTLQADPKPLREMEEARFVLDLPDLEEFEAEEEPEAPEPELELEEASEMPQLSLDQLDIALNVGTGGALAGDFAMPNLGGATAADLDPEAFVDFADLDQMPRPIGVSGFNFPQRLKRRKAQGRIVLLLKLSHTGQVISATVEASDLPHFDDFIRNEVESWRFTPPTQNGRPVNAHARLPIPIKIS